MTKRDRIVREVFGVPDVWTIRPVTFGEINPMAGKIKASVEDEYDFEDVDCVSCGLKFYIRPSLYNKANGKPWPSECEWCRKGLPPLYEY